MAKKWESGSMIIGIDGTCLLGERTGAGWYLTHLLEALSHVLEEDRAYVWLNDPTPEEKARVSENRFISPERDPLSLGRLEADLEHPGHPLH